MALAAAVGPADTVVAATAEGTAARGRMVAWIGLDSLGRSSVQCLRFPDGADLCRTVVLPDTADADGQPVLRFVLRQGADVRTVWDTDWPMSSGDRGVEAVRGDLDGDGASDLALMQHASSGMGMGVEGWAVLVGPESADAPTATLWAEDAGEGTLALTGGRLRVFQTAWAELPESDGGHKAFAGRTLRYDGGRFVPEGPARARRYTFAFEGERGRGMSRAFPDPSRWLARDTVAFADTAAFSVGG